MRDKYRTATIVWILQRDWELAITLTFKKDCTEHRSRKTMKRLWNSIDRQLYQKAFKKQGKKLSEFVRLRKGRAELIYIITLPPPHPKICTSVLTSSD